jgi:septum formation topological specificity factor MinE
MEEETEKDIILARKRREANERYFQQVNSGVLNIVAKLEEVATAMRQVEKESKEIWSEGESSGSVTGSATEATDSPLTNR